jgi:K+-sensing histidine kinase KdpD
MARDSNSAPQNPDETRELIHRQMLAAVSHDLKTPLATVIGSLEIYTRMEEKLTKEKRTALINSALSEAYRLDNFITNILDMAKLESGMVKMRAEQFDLTSLLQDCLKRLGPKRARADIRLRPEGTNTIITTDPMLLSRAAGLILENALRHAGKNPVIIIEYGWRDQEGFIRVRDNGPGIPAGKEDDIFSKYTRFAKNDSQNAGTGLGLAICRQLMQLISGSVQVSNHPEGGAVFTLIFRMSHPAR